MRLTQNQSIGAIGKHATGAGQDYEVSIAACLVDGYKAELVIKPSERGQDDSHAPGLV